MRLFLKSLALLILSGCAGGLIELPDGTRIRQAWNANTPAEIETGETTITTGADAPQTQSEIRERSRSVLVYIGGGLILVGALVIGVLKYPTPGGLLIVAGGERAVAGDGCQGCQRTLELCHRQPGMFGARQQRWVE